MLIHAYGLMNLDRTHSELAKTPESSLSTMCQVNLESPMSLVPHLSDVLSPFLHLKSAQFKLDNEVLLLVCFNTLVHNFILFKYFHKSKNMFFLYGGKYK